MIVVAKKFIPTMSLANYYHKKKAFSNVAFVKVSHGLI